MNILIRSNCKYLSALIILKCLISIFLFGLTSEVRCQNAGKRPSVGLVLSGGGAHGISHLGVIKVMEEAGLRPDYITGVSMGSIIGGMYALGYTADSLYLLLKNTNWDFLLSNKIPENKIIFIEKDHFYNSIVSLPVSTKKIMLPSGLINGQQVENALGFYFWPAAEINDFSKLPIPFMCLATDILTYKKIDLKKGYLPDAIRASISVPSVFTPIKIDSMFLLDGGLVRNFAASEIREMGADIVIGSYAGYDIRNEEEKLQSISGIMEQIALFRSLEDFEKEKKFVDVLIQPETDEFSIAEFKSVDSLFMRGYKAALPHKGYFKRLADSLNGIEPQKPLRNILDKGSCRFDRIEINGNINYSDDQILGVLDIKPGSDVDRYMLRDRIDLLYGKAWFEKVKYRFINRNDSLMLAIDCTEKPQAMLYGSVHYDNSLLAGVIMGFSVKNLLTQRSVINMNSFIGQYYRFGLNCIQFIDRNQKFGLSLNFHADNTLIPKLEIKNEYGDVTSRNFIPGLSIHKMLGLNHMMTLSTDFENLNLILRYVSDTHLKSLSYNYMTSSYQYQLNTLDSKHFPDKGMMLNISGSTSKLISGYSRTDSSKVDLKNNYGSNFSFSRFYTISGNYKHYFPMNNKITLSIGGNLLYITDSDSVSEQNNFYLVGGIETLDKRSIPMVGFQSNEIPVKKMASVNSELDIELLQNLHLDIMADIAGVQEVNRKNGFSFLTGYGIGIGYLSVIGPLKIGIMQGNYKNEKYFNKTKGYISIGYNF